MGSKNANLDAIDWVKIAPKVAEMIMGRPPDSGYSGTMRWNKYPGSLNLFSERACFADFAQGVGGDVIKMVSHLCRIELLDAPAWLCRNGFVSEASALSMRDELRTRQSDEDAKIREARGRDLSNLVNCRDIDRHFLSTRDFEKLRTAGRDLAEEENLEVIAHTLPWNNPDRLKDPLYSDANIVYYRRRYASEGEAIGFKDAKQLAVSFLKFRLPDLTKRKEATTWRTSENAELVLAEYLSQSKLSELIEESKYSSLNWWALQHYLRDLREREVPVPPALLQWALDVAEGKRSEPSSRRGPRPEYAKIRNRQCVRVLKALKSCGLPLRRDGRTEQEKRKGSGCDAVAEALGCFGWVRGYDAIVKIWQRRNNARPPDKIRQICPT